MTQPFTTIRIYKRDKSILNQYGESTHEAFHAMARKQCPHPENKRTYVTAELPGEGQEALTENGTRRVSGFLCGACNRYTFFPPADNLPVAE